MLWMKIKGDMVSGQIWKLMIKIYLLPVGNGFFYVNRVEYDNITA